MTTGSRSSVVLFDGLCGLCDGSVRWLLKADRRQRLLFAPLQGETAARVFARHARANDANSVVFVQDMGGDQERLYFQSDAVLAIINALGGAWRLLWLLRIVPAFLRDGVYSWVARHRMQWFGRLPSCRIPEPANQTRFLP